MKPRTLALALAVATAAAGCGKKSSSDQAGAAGDQGSAAPATRPLDAAFFGSKVAPLGPLAKLSWGMPADAAHKAAPALFPKPGGDKYQLSDDPTYADVSYGVSIDKDSKRVSRMTVDLPASARALIAKAWGPGKDGKDSIGKPRTFWFDPATGWRAYLEEGFGDKLGLEFHTYLPAAKLLGDGPDGLGFAPKGILGATLDDLRARFPDTIVETDAAAAAAERKKVEKLAGQKLDQLGAAKPSVRLDLAPTEWGEYWTRIQIDWADDGTVGDAWFDLPYEAYAPARDDIKKVLDAKWGAPKQEEKYGEPILVYRAKDPRVVVKDDTITHAWNVRISTK
jgi:hypothetical protein